MPPSANSSVACRPSAPRSDFALWAQTYDHSPNPLLRLEHRILSPILTPIAGQDILEIGCGTGRWLEQLSAMAPRSLTGVDYSAEMLARAQAKIARQACLAVADANVLPLPDRSVDLVLASFVLSYISDRTKFVAEVRRVLRAGGKVFLSDVHPDTSTKCNWDRGFRVGDRHITLTTSIHPLDQVRSSWEAAGFKVHFLLQPPFDSPERDMFKDASKLDAFNQAAGLPAIYILELQLCGLTPYTARPARNDVTELRLTNARVALNSETSVSATANLAQGRIASLSSMQSGLAVHTPEVDLSGCLLLPGLINAHDHLEFGLYPNLGRGSYLNCKQWANDIQQSNSSTIASLQAIPKSARIWWGAIRNLLCGVTLVCHHNPLPEFLNDNFPVQVLRNFGWAHSLAMDDDPASKFKATPAGVPFFIHAGEGIDDASAHEFDTLDSLGMLDQRTFVIHGLSLDRKSIALLNRRGVSLIWCPTSNRFLFGRTHDRQTISSLDRVLLGSDSPLTAAGDLLDEVRVAHNQIGVAATDIYAMLFDRAAGMPGLAKGQGTIRADAPADLIAVRDSGLTPGATLAGITTNDIELVVVAGQINLASDRLFKDLPSELSVGLEPLEVNSQIRWIRAPLASLWAQIEPMVGREVILGGKHVRYVGKP